MRINLIFAHSGVGIRYFQPLLKAAKGLRAAGAARR
jgi:hypothetical protein